MNRNDHLRPTISPRHRMLMADVQRGLHGLEWVLCVSMDDMDYRGRMANHTADYIARYVELGLNELDTVKPELPVDVAEKHTVLYDHFYTLRQQLRQRLGAS